ncbi:MAG: hypothetical protein R2849_00125 [Thermomicrobiales bacterium]
MSSRPKGEDLSRTPPWSQYGGDPKGQPTGTKPLHRSISPFYSSPFVLILIPGCGGAGAAKPTATPVPPPTFTPDPTVGEEVEIGEFTGLLWGSGDYGSSLVGASSGAASAWRGTAVAIADENMTVLALNDYSYDYVVRGDQYLRGERGVDAVALIGASTGAPPVIGAGIIAPELVDQMILISGFGEYERMGDFRSSSS